MDNQALDIVANEARIRDARVKESYAKGGMEVLTNAVSVIQNLLNTVNADYFAAKAERDKAEATTTTVITDQFGPYSDIDQALRAERFSGKKASVEYIKANPTCVEADAVQAWVTAAVATHPGLSVCMVDPAIYAGLYRANLVKAGLIPEATYEAQRAWILATPTDTIMGY